MIRYKPSYPRIFYIAAYFIAITLLLAFLYLARPVLIPLAFASLGALLLFPLVTFFERNGFHRIVAILISLILVILAMAGLIFLLSSQVVGFIEELDTLKLKLKDLMYDAEWFAYKNFNIQLDQKSDIIQESWKKFLDSGVVLIGGTINTFLSLFNMFALIPIYIFLFLLYRNSFQEFILVIVPIQQHRTVRSVTNQIQKVVQNYIVGLLIVIFIVGILNSVGLMIIGVQYAIFFGFLASFLTIIPYVGLVIGSLLPAIYAFVTHDSIWYPVAVIFTFMFIQFLEGNFITPRITGNKVKVNPLAAIVALVVGGYLWGIAGLILSIPMVAMLKVIFDHVPKLRPYGFLLGTEIYGREKAEFSAAPNWGRQVFKPGLYKPKKHRVQARKSRLRK